MSADSTLYKIIPRGIKRRRGRNDHITVKYALEKYTLFLTNNDPPLTKTDNNISTKKDAIDNHKIESSGRQAR
jgi:hypothetical protein